MLGIFAYINLQFWPSKSNILDKYKIYIPASLPLLTPFFSLKKSFLLLSAYWILSNPQDSVWLIFKKLPLSIQSVSGTLLALFRFNTTHRPRYQRAYSLIREIDNYERVQKRGWFIVFCVCVWGLGALGGCHERLQRNTTWNKAFCLFCLFYYLLFIVHCVQIFVLENFRPTEKLQEQNNEHLSTFHL